MANSQITFTEINFKIEDEVTHCQVRWTSDEPTLCGYGANKTFPASISVINILSQVDISVLTDSSWIILR